MPAGETQRIFRTWRRRSRSELIEPADESTVSLFAEEPRIEEILHGGAAVVRVETPQPLDLPPSET